MATSFTEECQCIGPIKGLRDRVTVVSIVVFGVNHRTGPLSLLERVTIADDAIAKTVHGLMARPNIREVVVLSTCNRTEVYAVAEKFHGAYGDLRDFFCDLGGFSPEELTPHVYSQHDDAAISHLFEVAAGLDSAVVGESEILGQVRSAWERSQHEGGSLSTLNLLFRHAIETGKRARTETSIGRHTTSVSQAAVDMARENLGTVEGLTVLVVGAGDMGEGVTIAMADAGISQVLVTNRTIAKAQALADRVSGSVTEFYRLAETLTQADVVVTCTGAGTTVIDVEMVSKAMQQRASRPLFIVDIAVPRDVESDVATIDGVTLLDLDNLRDWAARGQALRAAEAQAVRNIVAEELERFTLELTARQAAPLVALLHARAEVVRLAEIDRLQKKLSSLSDEQQQAVDALTKGIVAKLLHDMSVRLKDDAGTPRGERNSAAVRDLFDLS
ncbi:MAG: glutamyl-tRNA reductase [Ilumatobacteraceae bacterium]|nr:glutamyl-tRNA reductase [Ilumatobacteraceae bacterium]